MLVFSDCLWVEKAMISGLTPYLMLTDTGVRRCWLCSTFWNYSASWHSPSPLTLSSSSSSDLWCPCSTWASSLSLSHSVSAVVCLILMLFCTSFENRKLFPRGLEKFPRNLFPQGFDPLTNQMVRLWYYFMTSIFGRPTLYFFWRSLRRLYILNLNGSARQINAIFW